MNSHMALAVEAIDVKDKRTGQLAALLALTECLVYSGDKSLRRPGLAPPDLAPILVAVKASDAADAIPSSITSVGTLTVVSMDAAVEAAAKHLRLPKLAGWSLLAVLAAWLFADPTRRAKIGHALGIAVDATGQLLVAGEAAKIELASAAIDAFESPPLECHIAAALAFSSEPMTVAAVHQTIVNASQLPRVEPSDTEIRSTLRALPCFTESPRHRWQLGNLHAALAPHVAS